MSWRAFFFGPPSSLIKVEHASDRFPLRSVALRDGLTAQHAPFLGRVKVDLLNKKHEHISPPSSHRLHRTSTAFVDGTNPSATSALNAIKLEVVPDPSSSAPGAGRKTSWLIES